MIRRVLRSGSLTSDRLIIGPPHPRRITHRAQITTRTVRILLPRHVIANGAEITAEAARILLVGNAVVPVTTSTQRNGIIVESAHYPSSYKIMKRLRTIKRVTNRKSIRRYHTFTIISSSVLRLNGRFSYLPNRNTTKLRSSPRVKVSLIRLIRGSSRRYYIVTLTNRRVPPTRIRPLRLRGPQVRLLSSLHRYPLRLINTALTITIRIRADSVNKRRN